MSKAYFSYLEGVSRKAQLYRRFYLHPKILTHTVGKVLDVGCGLGDFVSYAKCDGVDINSNCVDHCIDRGLSVTQMQPDRLPFSDGKFGTVVLDNVLEHIESPKELLSECFRVLTDNGRLIIGLPGPKGFRSDRDHKMYYDRQKSINLLLTCNFFPLTEFRTPLPFGGNFVKSFCTFYVSEKINVH